MTRNRILLILWIVLVIISVIFMNNYGVQIILLLSVAIPVSGVIFAGICSSGLQCKITSEVSVLKGETLHYDLNIRNNKVTGCAYGKAVIEITNMLTGMSELKSIAFSISGKSNKTFSDEIETKYCGRIQIELKELISEDFMGIYEKHKSFFNKTYSLVMPDTFPVDIEIGRGGQCDINSDEYSMYKPGSDPSETFAVREYRPGDNIKNIHWKLSEKLNEVTVRELGLPVNNSILLIIDSIKADSNRNTESLMDNIGEYVISVAQVLTNQQIPFTLSWHDTELNQMKQDEILNNNALSEHLSDVLSSGPFESKNSILEEYEKDIGYPEFAHIIVVTGNESTNQNEIYNEINITRLVCNNDKPLEKIMYIEV